MPKVSSDKTSQKSKTFQSEWLSEEWAIGWLIKGRTIYSARCTMCDKDLVAGKSELKKHTQTSSHMKAAKQVSNTTSQVFEKFFKSDDCIKAELNTVALVARRNISFHFVPHLLSTLKYSATDSNIVQKMSCGKTKTTYLRQYYSSGMQ